MTKQMESFAERKLDYAIFPCDGVFNMSLKMGAKCAKIVGAKHNIPIHLKPHALFDRRRADKWDAPNKLIIEPGQEIILHSAGKTIISKTAFQDVSVSSQGTPAVSL
jgi:L-ascorbate metabolism protein UlaG (beta-lactamase superfamily)